VKKSLYRGRVPYWRFWRNAFNRVKLSFFVNGQCRGACIVVMMSNDQVNYQDSKSHVNILVHNYTGCWCVQFLINVFFIYFFCFDKCLHIRLNYGEYFNLQRMELRFAATTTMSNNNAFINNVKTYIYGVNPNSNQNWITCAQ
jgi:hypothetical protein